MNVVQAGNVQTFNDVAKAVFALFTDMHTGNVPMSSAIVQQEVIDLTCLECQDFKASAGWLRYFKGGVASSAVIVGKGASASFSGASSWLEDKLLHILAQYESRDITVRQSHSFL